MGAPWEYHNDESIFNKLQGALNQFTDEIKNTKHGIGDEHPKGLYDSNIGERGKTTRALMRDDPWAPRVVRTCLPNFNS